MVDAQSNLTVLSARQPVIILGMHRSGTSMVAELLDELGLFVGREVQGDHESTHFLAMNETIFARVNACWDNPLPMRHFLASAEAMKMTTQALKADLSSRRIRKFLPAGVSSLEKFDEPWGWKDPRTTFTLPIWLKLFPGARIIHIIRNGVDVAASLMVRERKLLERRVAKFDARIKKMSLRSALDRAGYKGSARCLSIEGGFALWKEYVEHAEGMLNSISDLKFENSHWGFEISNLKFETGISNLKFEIRYEDILENPRKHLAEMARFCQLKDVSDAKMTEVVGRVNSSRGRAFASDAQLSAFYEKVKSDPWMVHYRY